MGKQSAAPAQNSYAPWQTPPPTGTHTGGGIYDLVHKNDKPAWAPDFIGAAQQMGRESANNAHPNQRTPFASSSWVQDPKTGAWTQSVGFSGGLADAYKGLSSQAAGLANPFDLSGLPSVSGGADARAKAEEALYGRMTSRLDPQFAKDEASLRTRLANQGLDPTSAAYTKALDDFGRSKNDAYASARRDAISGGGAEASREFGMDMTRRQQMLGELLRKRSLPLEELGRLQGFSVMPGFQMGATAPWLQGMQAAGNYALGQTDQANKNNASAWGGGMQLLGALGALPFGF